MTTVYTENWEAMMDFYCRIVGMEAENQTFMYIVSLKGLKGEIRLQRVYDKEETEVIGRLELETDEAGFDRLLKNRGTSPFAIQSVDSGMELTIRDPDNNPVYFTQESVAANAA